VRRTSNGDQATDYPISLVRQAGRGGRQILCLDFSKLQDHLAGGNEVACGWLKDKYGLAWQVVPNALMELIQDKDPGKSQRVMAAMLQMKKIDIAGLQAAHAGS
jgi:3-demethylubiquinone-9 3-methyltransferase